MTPWHFSKQRMEAIAYWDYPLNDIIFLFLKQAYPQQRSLKKNPVVKYISGGILLVVIIFIIWFPLVFFSFFNAVFISNPPTEATITIGIGGYQPLFRTTALGGGIRKLADTEFNSLKSFYARDRVRLHETRKSFSTLFDAKLNAP